ncbi:hypothetical protein ACIF8T_28755 [Streptomyces sp. NPDC085946]|uniref:hypothetical protein n=1 Tax=Streptomyces sp. NPDC085946 TaxID=3365744 RepID=UPI0037D427CD
MTVDQLAVSVREFAHYLDGLLARLDQGGGWCGVFWQRDPDGMRACLDGREVPPWDVVEALLQDLAAAYGPSAAGPEQARARRLHAAALAAYDARPGGRDALGDRLDVMLREQRHAAGRQAELGRALASAVTREEADALRVDLAWARDDHLRATARCAELRARMAALDDPAVRPDGTVPDGTGFGGTGAVSPGTGPGGTGSPGTVMGPPDVGPDGTDAPGPVMRVPATDTDPGGTGPAAGAPSAGPGTPPSAPPAPAPRPRKRRRGSARFAGMAEEDTTAPVVEPQAPAPAAPVPAPAPGRTPRGARFAGAAETAGQAAPATQPAETVDTEGRREVARAVDTLARLRGEGRSGQAHALLAEVAYWPAARFPLLAAALQHAGLGADWATLLWEAASLPVDRLVAAADALAAAGRAPDGQQILRQGVVRPAHEIGRAVLGLTAGGRDRETGALLDAYVRMRAPEEAARSAEPDPGRLVPLLLEAARGVSRERHRDLLHALRVAGFPV